MNMNNNNSDDATIPRGGGAGGAGRGRGGAVKDGWHLPSSSFRPRDDSAVLEVMDDRDPIQTVISQPPFSSSSSSSPFSLSLSRIHYTESSFHSSQLSTDRLLISAGRYPQIEEQRDVYYEENNNNNNNNNKEEEEEAEDESLALAMRLQREEEESIRLAQQLMAEEAMASYQHMAQDYLRNNQGEFSEADLAALQSAMDDGGDGQEHHEGEGGTQNRTTDDEGMAYDLMMRLGENLGDVKTERWKFIAKEQIDQLPLIRFDPDQQKSEEETNDCDVKCLICQYDYEKDESLRRLPCNHCFHQECVDEWLRAHDSCPYCKKPIHDGNA
jgi:Ring finger domain